MFFPRKVLVLAAALTALVALPAAASAAPKLSSPETALLKEINHVRSSHGLRALAFDPTLTRAARAHSLAMSAQDVFAHGAFRARMLRFHAKGPVVGENLAWGTGAYGTPQGIVKAWLASPEHRANLLHAGFSRIGLGDLQTHFHGADGVHVVTADFAGV
jgi:uncharacterized protein YkwD